MSPVPPIARVAATAALMALAPGCRHAAATQPADAGGDPDGAPDSGLPDWADPGCSATMSATCGALADSLFEVALDADDLAGGGSWRFVDIGGFHGVLARRDLGDGPEPVVVFPDPWILGGIQLTIIAVLPDSVEEQLEPVAVTDAPAYWNDDETEWLYAVLAKTQTGYVVYGVPELEPGDSYPDDHEDPSGLTWVPMQPMPGGEDLVGDELQGIERGLVGSSAERLCVYGDGIRCTAGAGWTFAVAAGSGQLNAMSFQPIGDAWGLTVGDDGLMIRLLESGWQVVPTGTDDDLRVVLGTSAGYYAAGEDGVYTTLYNLSPQPSTAETAHIASADIADLIWPLPFDPEAAGGIEISGITTDGCAFDLKGTEVVSCFAAGALDGPVIGSTYWTVPMVASGRFFLTEDRLYRFTVQSD